MNAPHRFHFLARFILPLVALPQGYFGLYLLVMSISLLLAMSSWAGIFVVMWLILAWLSWRQAKQPSWKHMAWICLFLALAMNVSYAAMSGALPALRTIRFDATLLSLDRWLIGETPSILLQSTISFWLTEILSLCYIGFMPLLFFSLLRYFFRDRHLLGEFYSGLFTVYGLGFLGYLLVPAAGPWTTYPELFSVKLSGGPVTYWNTYMVVAGSNRVDVWPSLHSAVAIFILGFCGRHHRRQFYWLLTPVLGLCFSTVYLRYHYFLDLVCGVLLAAYSLRQSHRYAAAVNNSSVLKGTSQ